MARQTALTRFSEALATRLIAALKEGRAPWQQPWAPGEPPGPINGLTGRPYHGANRFWLMLSGRTDPRWAGFHQIRHAGGSVRSGERGTMILIAKQAYSRQRTDPESNELNSDNVIPVDEPDPRPRMFLGSAHVFNFDQAEGLPPIETAGPPVDQSEAGRKLDEIIRRAGVRIEHSRYHQPCYRRRDDVILMPEPVQFADINEYRQTVIHEIAHATGHPSRMDRWRDSNEKSRIGTPAYAVEELRAEITAMSMARHLGVAHNPDLGSSEAYIAHWIQGLENDPDLIRRVCADAEAITAWLTDPAPAGALDAAA